jgi:hypothetical protein
MAQMGNSAVRRGSVVQRVIDAVRRRYGVRPREADARAIAGIVADLQAASLRVERAAVLLEDSSEDSPTVPVADRDPAPGLGTDELFVEVAAACAALPAVARGQAFPKRRGGKKRNGHRKRQKQAKRRR